jgi:hypothetical protein
LDETAGVVIDAIKKYDADANATVLKDVYSSQTLKSLARIGDDIDEDIAIRNKIARFLVANTDGMIKVHHRPKHNRPPKRCFENAIDEHKKTGNRVVYAIVIADCLFGHHFISYIPHGINYDEKTKTYYDTTDNSVPDTYTAYNVTDKFVSIVKFMDPRGQARIDVEVGGFSFLNSKGKVYAVEGKDTQNKHSIWKQARVVAVL